VVQSLYKNSKICLKYNEGQINTSQGVRQGFGLSPDLFNLHINKAVKEWKRTTQNGIQLTTEKKIQTTVC
jgi:hypothetical protein